MQVILHIGAPKTGTTALQTFFSSNAELYAEAGLLYPVTGRKFNNRLSARHHGFGLAMSGPEGSVNKVMQRNGLSSDAARVAYVNSFRSEFDREIAKHQPDTVLISNEDLFLVHDGSLIEEFSTFLDERFDKRRVICHLRNPVDYVRGRYSTAAKSGRLTSVDFKTDKRFEHGIFLPHLKNWSEFFDHSELEVTIARADSITRMLNQLGLGELGERPETGANRSLTTQGLELMIALNAHYPMGRRPKIIRSAFEKTMTGDPFVLPSSVVTDIWQKFGLESASLAEKFLTDATDIRTVHEDWQDTQRDRSDDLNGYQTDPALIDLIAHLVSQRRRKHPSVWTRKALEQRLKRRVPHRIKKVIKHAIGRKNRP